MNAVYTETIDGMPILRETLEELKQEIKELKEDVNAKHEENVKRFMNLDSHLLHHDSQLHDVKVNLFGEYGQPGTLDKLSGRISKLEIFMWRAFGFISAIVAIASLVQIMKK